MAADTHWSLVAWLTKSPFPYRFTAYGPAGVGVGVGEGVGVGVGLGGGIEIGSALEAGAGLGVEGVRDGRVGVGVGEGTSGTEVPTAAATAPVPGAAHAATSPRTTRLMRAARHGGRRAGEVKGVGRFDAVARRW